METCPFCDLRAAHIYLENDVAAAIPDAFPVAQGHTLVVPKRHVASIFDLSEDEQAAVWRLVAQVRAKLWHDLAPDAFNIGINDGTAAGESGNFFFQPGRLLLRAAKKGVTFAARGGQISGCAMGCGMQRIVVGAGKV